MPGPFFCCFRLKELGLVLHTRSRQICEKEIIAHRRLTRHKRAYHRALNPPRLLQNPKDDEVNFSVFREGRNTYSHRSMAEIMPSWIAGVMCACNLGIAAERSTNFVHQRSRMPYRSAISRLVWPTSLASSDGPTISVNSGAAGDAPIPPE